MHDDVDVVVVGGGVIGLAIARALAARRRDVIVVEQNAYLGAEASSRNSEVLHAGLYYPPGSLRARFCVDGLDQLTRYCREHGVATHRCGKLIVANSDNEAASLTQLIANAKQNGVSGLVALDSTAARDLEPDLNCVTACLSPNTGIIDSHGLLQALEADVLNDGGTIALRTRVSRLIASSDTIDVVTARRDGGDHTLRAKLVVNAAGLGATALSESLDSPSGTQPPRTYYAKGHYFAYSGQVPFRHLIYPMPSDGGLGVHLTLDLAGRARFGPDIAWQETQDYTFDDPRARRHAAFVAAIERYWPDIEQDRLHPDSTGIRAKLSGPGEAMKDFAIHTERDHGIKGLIALYGINSPGLTSCLAIADYVAERASSPT